LEYWDKNTTFVWIIVPFKYVFPRESRRRRENEDNSLFLQDSGVHRNDNIVPISTFCDLLKPQDKSKGLTEMTDYGIPQKRDPLKRLGIARMG
jgi:hypothetical protein